MDVWFKLMFACIWQSCCDLTRMGRLSRSTRTSNASVARRISSLRKKKHYIVKHAKKHGKHIKHKYGTHVNYRKKWNTNTEIYGTYAEHIRTTCGEIRKLHGTNTNKHVTYIKNTPRIRNNSNMRIDMEKLRKQWGTITENIHTKYGTNTGKHNVLNISYLFVCRKPFFPDFSYSVTIYVRSAVEGLQVAMLAPLVLLMRLPMLSASAGRGHAGLIDGRSRSVFR
jgi:hypothetical protein